MISEQVQNTKRELLRLQTYSKFYVIIAAVVFIVFGLFGIIPLSISAKNTFVLLNRVNTTNALLAQKYEDLKKAETILFENKILLQKFISYLPENYTIQDYLLDLSTVASINRYRVDRVNVNGRELEVVFEGSGDIPELIKDIEGLQSITQVAEVRINPLLEEGRQSVFMSLKVFGR